MSLFNSTIAQALATVDTVAGDLVTYRRGQLSTTWKAARGKTVYEIESEFAATITTETADFLGAAADLAFTPGSPITPQKGDEITTPAGTFEVIAAAGDKCFRYSDPEQTRLRIHAQQIS